jgi:hypothetical protein
MNQFFGHPVVVVLLVLGAVLAAIACPFLLLSWRDSVRALREFFALPKRWPRPRFRLRTLLFATALCAAVLKLGVHCQWWRAWWWLDRVFFALVALIVLLTIGLLVQLYSWSDEPRIVVQNVKPIGPPGSEQPTGANSKKHHKRRNRFEVKKRRIIPFRW